MIFPFITRNERKQVDEMKKHRGFLGLGEDDWMLWFHAAVVWFVVLISAWQRLGSD